jgi:NAD(P)-dependent dehydrogenase (short-subunit alcohol dehydrogenase family)
MSKVLITGASGGFGRLTVKALAQKGHTVVASLRDSAGRNSGVSAELTQLGAKVVELDVTDTGSVERGVQAALSAAGGLDAVINNAGVGVLGLQEAFTPEDWQRLFDINVFGVQRVNRAILPHFREQRRGLLVHVSSLLGRLGVPFYGPYVASKWALEGMVESYRAELSNFGVEACLVEPGGYPTTFIANLMRPSDPARAETYGEMAASVEPFLKGFEHALASNPAQNPEDVASAIVGLVEAPAGKRPHRTIVDKMGMGTAVEAQNQALATITQNIYNAFGIGHLLEVKV